MWFVCSCVGQSNTLKKNGMRTIGTAVYTSRRKALNCDLIGDRCCVKF